ncbi:ligase-associated DNA damage response endonuclease PdeM [Stratiformator vulcanicus]|uniref:Calcineurin-like phosphoesterase n=1 Tax=Stratiformator vulcanicus TaxID=2527980 RepID=A0A517R7A1_9PLAN|nr:ligase-associated DNA damage response endonuclease PdeM [Stratiformator vulcanicus]QDT39767.1 Calcineurin-like phosphoesterase [Stratiformator vulcanicus]
MQHGLPVEVAGELLTLLPDHAVFWNDERALIIADPHWGKEATFRAHGIPIPAGVMRRDLLRLTDCVTKHKAERLIVLGDLMHARTGRDEAATMQEIAEWRKMVPKLECILIRGNHDRSAGDPAPEWGFSVVDEPHRFGPFELRHFPLDASEAAPRRSADDPFVLAGHLHPKVKLAATPQETLKLPCFYLGASQFVLPAFSSFVDGGLISPVEGDRVFVVADSQVIEVRTDTCTESADSRPKRGRSARSH